MARLNIGLRQARRLCEMPHGARLTIISEGLPVILESARGFWAASRQLQESPREADVLAAFAEEEAAKILILMDLVRCPSKVAAVKVNKIIGWFYDHLARLIYAEAANWKPMHVAQLRHMSIRNEKRTTSKVMLANTSYLTGTYPGEKASSMPT